MSLSNIFRLSDGRRIRVFLANIDELDLSVPSPNVMTRQEFDMLERSIRRFGLIEPVVVGRRNEEGKFPVLDGRHRVEAARRAGIFQIICVECLDLDADETLFLPSWLTLAKGRARKKAVESYLSEVSSQLDLPPDRVALEAGLYVTGWLDRIRAVSGRARDAFLDYITLSIRIPREWYDEIVNCLREISDDPARALLELVRAYHRIHE